MKSFFPAIGYYTRISFFSKRLSNDETYRLLIINNKDSFFQSNPPFLLPLMFSYEQTTEKAGLKQCEVKLSFSFSYIPIQNVGFFSKLSVPFTV